MCLFRAYNENQRCGGVLSTKEDQKDTSKVPSDTPGVSFGDLNGNRRCGVWNWVKRMVLRLETVRAALNVRSCAETSTGGGLGPGIAKLAS